MRLPDIDTTKLTDEQQQLHDALSTRPEVRAMGLVGPFGVWMHAPDVGAAMAQLGARVRFATSLPANVTEVAICTTGAHFRAPFEFAAHRRLALQAGVDEAGLDRLASGQEPGFEGDDATAHAVARELLSDHAVSPGTYADARRRFGDRGMVELVTTVGYYSLISLLLNGFEVPLAPGMTDPFAS